MSDFGPAVVTVIAGIIGLAIVAVLVAQKAQTSTVLTGAGSALAQVIHEAVSPVTGSSTFASNGAPAQGQSQ